MKRLYLDGTKLALDTPYNKAEVTALKQNIKSARWDRLNKVWRIPAKDIHIAIDFAIKWDIDVDHEVLGLSIPEHPIGNTDIVVSGDIITVTLPYDPLKVSTLKALPGVKWDPQNKNWVAPVTAINPILNWALTYEVDLSDDLREYAEREREAAERALELCRATDAPITVPNLQMALYGFQKAGVAYAAEQQRTFIADEMGLGKSVEAIATAEYTNKYPVLIICPSNLIEDWHTKIQEALPNRTVQIILGRKPHDLTDADFTIIGYPNIHAQKKALISHKFKSLVLDESHYCKNPTAQRTKAAKAIAKKIPDDGLVLLLTGTPVTNMPAEYAPQLEILGLIEEFGGRWNFYKRYCAAYKDEWGVLQIGGRSNSDELLEKLRTLCYIRREKVDVLPDLPPMTHNLIHVTMEPRFKTEYNHALLDFADWYAEHYNRRYFISAEHEDIRELTALRQIVANSKLKPAIEWVRNANEQGQKVVIAAHHRHIVQSLASELDAVMIIGGQSAKATEAAKQEFQNDADVMNIVISNQAAAHGHTLTAASNMLMIEAPWTPTDYMQIAGRIHRIGQTQPATIHNMVNWDTIDKAVYGVLLSKEGKILPVTSDSAERVLHVLLDGLHD